MKRITFIFTTLIVIALGALYYLFGEEDYYPEPNSIDFYLKLSSVIRNFPIIAPQQTPAYFGSIGDGSKVPQSTVSYLTHEKNEQILVSAINNYLHRKQFTLDPSLGRVEQAFDASGNKILHEAAFTKAGGNESIVFRIYLLSGKGALGVDVTHFE